MITSTVIEKVFDEIQHPFMIKKLSKLRIEENFLNKIKSIYDISTTNIILNGERLKAVFIR